MIKESAVVLFLILSSGIAANADTYKWVDDKGVVNFTDDPGAIPSKYRARARREEDITIRNPKIQQENKEQQELKGQSEQKERARPTEPTGTRTEPVPEIKTPLQVPPGIEQPKAASDELPPGRPKSQRIRENIERREAEEKLKQGAEKKY